MLRNGEKRYCGAAELRMLRDFGAAAIGGPGFLL
jgi:hypothetical protein